MYNSQPREQAASSLLTKSIEGMALVLSGTTTFFITPPTYSNTIAQVQNFTAHHYGLFSGLESMVAISWWLIIAIAIFVVMSFLSSILLLSLASRFFSRFL